MRGVIDRLLAGGLRVQLALILDDDTVCYSAGDRETPRLWNKGAGMIRNSTWKLIRRATGTAAILAVVIVLVVI